MDRLMIKDFYMMRSENQRLLAEREGLIRMVGAALVLMHDLDADTFQSFEAAELMADCLDHLPERVLDEAMSLCRA